MTGDGDGMADGAVAEGHGVRRPSSWLGVFAAGEYRPSGAEWWWTPWLERGEGRYAHLTPWGPWAGPGRSSVARPERWVGGGTLQTTHDGPGDQLDGAAGPGHGMSLGRRDQPRRPVLPLSLPGGMAVAAGPADGASGAPGPSAVCCGAGAVHMGGEAPANHGGGRGRRGSGWSYAGVDSVGSGCVTGWMSSPPIGICLRIHRPLALPQLCPGGAPGRAWAGRQRARAAAAAAAAAGAAGARGDPSSSGDAAACPDWGSKDRPPFSSGGAKK